MKDALFLTVWSQITRYVVNNRKQLTKFVIVGIITFILYFFLVYLFYSVLHCDYRIAVSFAYALTVVCHFALHRWFTFDGPKERIQLNAGKYLLMLGINYSITLTVVWAAVHLFEYSPYVGALLGIVATTLSSFFIMKYFVFRSGMRPNRYFVK